jgi:hypothetical protein
MALKYLLLVEGSGTYKMPTWEVMSEDMHTALSKEGMRPAGAVFPIEYLGLTQETLRDYVQALNDYENYLASRGPRLSDEEQVRADSYELKMKDLEKVIVAGVERTMQ